MPRRTPRVAVIGAGMSGLLAGVKLREAGIEDFTIFEKTGDVGGTWNENRYPGLSCDVPSHLYSYSFDLNPDWTHRYSYGPEIHAYFQRFADKYALRPHIQPNAEIVEAAFSPGGWRLQTGDGATHTADFVISAAGVLHHPRYPAIEGLDTFAGPCFHTARWPDDLDLTGKRVGVVGTGSTAIQLIPRVQQVAARLTVFQRTAQWIMPVPNHRYSEEQQARLRRFPLLNRLVYRWYAWLFRLISSALLGNRFLLGRIDQGCRRNLETVRDPELRRKLTPDYQAGCKRLIMSAQFYPAVQKPNVEVVTERIARVTPAGVETDDGRAHPLDVLILATGFLAHNYMRPMKMSGEDGVTLEEAWRGGPRAYRTVALPGFPNFFMLMGPHSPVGNYSLIDIAERQIGYIMQCIARWCAGDFETIVPRADSTRAFNEQLVSAFAGTVWTTGCQSWYLDEGGVPNVWPFPYKEFQRQMRRPDFREYQTS